jgi:uncharacterized protein (DUF302 family)
MCANIAYHKRVTSPQAFRGNKKALDVVTYSAPRSSILQTEVSAVLPASATENKPTKKQNGIVDVPSNHSVDETVERLKAILQSKGITLFTLIDHSGEAEKVGMKMPPTKLLIFGNPKGGTPLMQAAPSIAIDLPLKILVWQDAQGKVWLSYNTPEYLQQRHGLPQDLLQNIAIVGTLAAKASE